jgi:site-specific DNA-methyltransferase (adenine-specific)
MNVELYHADCLEQMKSINNSSVDMVFCDLPYGTTQNAWDTVIPLDILWNHYNRIVKDNGAVVLTASQPFTSILISSNIKQFKFEWIWKKTIGSGQLNIKRQPLKIHESVLIFYKKPPVYNEQKTIGKPYSITRKDSSLKETNYGKQKTHDKVNDGFRHAQSIIEFSNPRIRSGHPTEKPVSLCEYFIKIYSNEGDTVLDNCMGSGSTGEASIKLNRNFIGIEKELVYFDMAKKRLNNP